MSDYVIMTDSGSDISTAKLAEWGVVGSALTFRFEDNIEYSNEDMDSKEFYQRMRDGEVSQTAAINMATFVDMFEPALKEGKDILYIGFSSGISSTSSSGIMAAKELQEEYPDRKIIAIDTKCASAGEGLMVWMAVQKKNEGYTLEQLADYVNETYPNIAHWFTVEDLVYLKRGGRVSAAAAFAGGMLGIKPVLHVDDMGCLINMAKVRGRSQSIKAIAKKYAETATDPANGPYFISHGDCLEDAKALEELIYNEFGNKCTLITEIGPVIGSHAGPGTLALFFPGTGR